MRWQPVPIGGGAYTDDTTPWTSQDRVNYMPVMAERHGTRSPVKVQQCPGASTYTTPEAAPVRGLHNAEGLLLDVCGTSLYTISTTGEATARGTIPGVARVSMAHNQITGGNEVAIANGLSGYIYNTKTATLAQITDSGFAGAKVFDFVDGYLVYVDAAGRFWGWSDLASGGSYNTIDRSDAESQPDRIVTLKVSHREVVVFGERTAEFFRNTGAGTGTFQRIDGTEMEIGCPSTHGVAKLDNSLFFVGHDGSAYRLDGYTPVRISTHAIEQAWSRCDLASCYSFTFEDQGHKVWVVTFTDGQTWCYDVASGEWHRRVSEGLDFWRMTDAVRWNTGWIAGDYSNGSLYFLDWNLSTEAGQQMVRSGVLHVMHDDENRMEIHAIKFLFDTGKDSTSYPPPIVWLTDLSIAGDLGNGPIAEVVSHQYTSSGGLFPHTFAIISGSLPDGLSMNSAGLVTGTRGLAGTYNWSVRVTDSDSRTADLDDTSITTPFTITGDVPNGTAAVATTGTYDNLGGIEPVTYAVTAGSFPTGLTLAADGSWSGTPTAGVYGPWTVTATDDASNMATLEDSATFSDVVTFSTTRVSGPSVLFDANRTLAMAVPGAISCPISVIKSTGKHYVEFKVQNDAFGNSTSLIASTHNDTSSLPINYYTNGATVLECRANGMYANNGALDQTDGPVFTAINDVIGVAYDADTRKVWIRDGDGWAGGGDPALGTLPLATLSAGTGNISIGIAMNYIFGYAQSVKMNAGQEAAAYTIPSGFAWVAA